MRFSIASLGEEPPDRYLDLVKLCELVGIDTLCHADEKWTRDVYVRLALAAGATERIGLGITVTDPYTRHPALTAQATATLGEASRGRLRVMMGAGSHFETMPGYASVRPAVGLREAAEVMRRLWAGERVSLDGAVVKFAGGKLDFAIDPAYIPGLWIAGRGPLILKAAGAVADGAMIGSFATPSGVNYAKAAIGAGLAEAGRSWSDIRLASWLYVSVLNDEDDPVPDGIRRGVSHALWSSREVVTTLLEGVDLSAFPEFTTFLHQAPHEWSPEIMAELRRLIPRPVIDQLALVGTAPQVAGRLAELEAEGVEECVAWPFPPTGMDIEDYVVNLAAELIPLVHGNRTRGEYQLVD
jgi:5,10-methylenetetrahydromethanopterin reductase